MGRYSGTLMLPCSARRANADSSRTSSSTALHAARAGLGISCARGGGGWVARVHPSPHVQQCGRAGGEGGTRQRAWCARIARCCARRAGCMQRVHGGGKWVARGAMADDDANCVWAAACGSRTRCKRPRRVVPLHLRGQVVAACPLKAWRRAMHRRSRPRHAYVTAPPCRAYPLRARASASCGVTVLTPFCDSAAYMSCQATTPSELRPAPEPSNAHTTKGPPFAKPF